MTLGGRSASMLSDLYLASSATQRVLSSPLSISSCLESSSAVRGRWQFAAFPSVTDGFCSVGSGVQVRLPAFPTRKTPSLLRTCTTEGSFLQSPTPPVTFLISIIREGTCKWVQIPLVSMASRKSVLLQIAFSNL